MSDYTLDHARKDFSFFFTESIPKNDETLLGLSFAVFRKLDLVTEQSDLRSSLIEKINQALDVLEKEFKSFFIKDNKPVFADTAIIPLIRVKAFFLSELKASYTKEIEQKNQVELENWKDEIKKAGDTAKAAFLSLGQAIKLSADAGSHYRYQYMKKLTQGEIENGYAVLKLDPFRIAAIYEMDDFALDTILKKCLKAGDRGHKDMKQDLKDIICAAERKLEMIEEDEFNND